MIDNFITYDDPNGPTESDGYLNKLRDEMFHFGAAPPQNYGFATHHQYPPQMNQMFQGDPTYEVFSHNSAYSTNPSTKESPEHTPSVEDHLGDDEKGSKVPPIVRKGIRKYYEPILDNGMVYNYEDDPNEYRKARKRIQNRESATRVRNRKKNHVEILEDEINDMKKSYNELQRENNMLLAENQSLRQKLSFFEKAVAKNNQAHQMNMNPNMSNQFSEAMPSHSDHILDFMDNTDNMGLNRGPQDFEHNQVNNMHPGMYRAANNSSKFKKHMALLGVFTLLLCVYGILPRTGVQLFALPKFTFTSSNNVNNVPTPNNSHENTVGKASTDTTTVNPTEKPDQSHAKGFGGDVSEGDLNDLNDADKQKENKNFSDENGPENKDIDHQDEKPEPAPAPANQNKNSKSGPGPNPNANKNKGPFRPPNHKPKKHPKGPERFGPNRRRMPPPNRGHHHPWQPRNAENNVNTISILSVIEILVVACYSLYFIYVGFSAYKLHAAKKRRGGAMPVPL